MLIDKWLELYSYELYATIELVLLQIYEILNCGDKIFVPDY